MSEIALAKINSFAPVRSDRRQSDLIGSDQIGSPSEDAVFVLTSAQLRSIVIGAIHEATGAILQELQDLKDQRTQDRAEFERFKATHRTFAVQTGKELDALFDATEKATTTPETTKKPAQKTQDHITRIAVILAAKEKRLIEGSAPRAYVDRLRKEGMTFSQLANVMGLTVDRIRQLSRIAATDQRFNITWHPRKKNTKIIKLRRWDAFVL